MLIAPTAAWRDAKKRVTVPIVTSFARRQEEIIARVKPGNAIKQFERICISMISHPNSTMPSYFSIAGCQELPQVPVSILSSPTSLDSGDLDRMRDPGKDIFTAAQNAVTPEIFDRARGGVDSPRQWDKCWCTTEWVSEIYENFVHLIFGVGRQRITCYVLSGALLVNRRAGEGLCAISSKDYWRFSH